MDAYALVKTIDRKQYKNNLHLVMNRADNEKEARSATDAFIHIAQRYTQIPINPLGYILRDESMVRAIKAQVPLMLYSPKCVAAANIETLAGRFEDQAEPDKKGIAGFLGKLLGKDLPGKEKR